MYIIFYGYGVIRYVRNESGQKIDLIGLGIMIVRMNERKIQGNKKRFDRERRKKKGKERCR